LAESAAEHAEGVFSMMKHGVVSLELRLKAQARMPKMVKTSFENERKPSPES
jgi:hypothetical protein